MSEHENDISLNEELFARIKASLRAARQERTGTHKLLEEDHNGFVRNGANLQGEAKEKYPGLCKRVSLLTLQFSENNLKKRTTTSLSSPTSHNCGLPESAVEAAAETAGEKGVEGWVFTLQAPSYGPFLTYGETVTCAVSYIWPTIRKCTHDNASSNLEIVKKLANVRMEIAQLLAMTTSPIYQEHMAQNS